MAYHITTELDRINQIIGAIRAMAKGSIDQALPDNYPPHWAITLELLSELATEELETVHNSLQFEIAPGGEKA
jgi:hypothetical protein